MEPTSIEVGYACWTTNGRCAEMKGFLSVRGAARVAIAVVLTTYPGTAYASSSISAPGQVVPLQTVTDFACASASLCVAVGEASAHVIGMAVTEDGGRTWHQVPLSSLSGSLMAVSCPDTRSCLAVGEVTNPRASAGDAIALLSSDGGKTWSRPLLGSSVPPLDALSCPTTTHCVAVGGYSHGPIAITYTSDGGAAWSTARAPAREGVLGGVSCVTQGRCVAAGGSPAVVVTSSDGGVSWTAEPPLPTADYLLGVSCVSGQCWVLNGGATGGTGPPSLLLASADAPSWSARAIPPTIVATKLACPAVDHCVVAGIRAEKGRPASGAVLITKTGGRSWSYAALPRGLAQVVTMSCRATEQCSAVAITGGGWVAIFSFDGGSTWRQAP
jgi:photosystem II stability/assembly factor-like uncharacterized protein